ncbi:hypothetical protein ACFQBQ_08450 [Granulicella cerasi]|uniref:Uncharacterized protein n=1 Tax=Granulicella cerasi TaxID=741063 RepID=A0ABW1ZA65_9BACT|nr:hypothetical protein [Granulicella cerasi]
MFARRVLIEAVDGTGQRRRAPLSNIDNFAMRNFTNDAVFDDTLPVADGLLEIGARVPVELLRDRMEDWFRRKRYLSEQERLEISEIV